MELLRLPLILIAVLLFCSFIPSGTAWEPVTLKVHRFFPDANREILVEPNFHPVLCALLKDDEIYGPDTKYYRYTVDPGSTKLDITLQWDAPQKHNPLKLQVTASNGETFGPYNDTDSNGKIHKPVSSPTPPSGEWIIAVTQTAAETTSFVLTIT